MSTQLPAVDPELPSEQVVERLEAKIDRLEDGGVPLDEAVDAYAQGSALAARAQELLDSAQLRVDELRE